MICKSVRLCFPCDDECKAGARKWKPLSPGEREGLEFGKVYEAAFVSHGREVCGSERDCVCGARALMSVIAVRGKGRDFVENGKNALPHGENGLLMPCAYVCLFFFEKQF